MPRRRDIDDDLDESLFEREEAQRRREEREAGLKVAAEREAQDKVRSSAARARAKANTLRTDAEFVRREYAAAGVTPPLVNDAGEPTCSLALLLNMGWTIQDLGHGNTLVEPPPNVPPPKNNHEGECS